MGHSRSGNPRPDPACGVRSARAHTSEDAAARRGAAKRLGAWSRDGLGVLRWDDAIPPSTPRAGGTRDPQELYSLLRLTIRRLPAQLAQIVLVDDVFASGGHLRAAAAFLTDCGAVVHMAVCAGRAENSDTVLERPFSIRTDVLPEFFADPDWFLPFTSG